MSNKSELIEQTNLAFDFLQRLYLEVSYLIKEIEAMLNDEPESFVIGKPGGYAISARKSAGLEASNVNLWLYKKFAVFFVPEEKTVTKGGQQSTRLVFITPILVRPMPSPSHNTIRSDDKQWRRQ